MNWLRTAAAAPLVALVAGVWCGSRTTPAIEKSLGRDDLAGSAACAGCHAAITREFHKSPHARTLSRMAETSLAERLADRRVQDPTRPSELAFFLERGRFFVACDQYGDGDPVELEWCFGSGEHAQTMVGVVSGPNREQWLVQCRLSWYADGDRLDLTPGELGDARSHGIAWLGRLSDEAQLRRCFGCHTTSWEERDGVVDLASLVLGIQCEKCHGPRQSHVATADIATARSAVPGLRHKSAIESIRWCGVCHRQDELVGPAELDPANVQLARFAPIGLVQSECFRRSPPDRQPTCLTCHNPHAGTEHDPVVHSNQCRACHRAGGLPIPTLCPVQPQAENCLPCHMPKIQVGSATFTDHWIRIPSSESVAAGR